LQKLGSLGNAAFDAIRRAATLLYLVGEVMKEMLDSSMRLEIMPAFLGTTSQ